MEKKLIELTSNLIRFKSTENNLEEREKIIEYVKKEFDGYKVYIREYKSSKSPSVVITLHRERNPYIFLNGHLDVVPAEERQFEPKVTSSKIYGRGAGDMKAACAVMIETMKYFSLKKKKPSVGLMLTTDEEVGGNNGVKKLLKRHRSKFAIIPDGDKNLKSIVLDQKGVFHCKVWTKGKSAHGSRPFLGENAIDKIIDIYQRIKKVIPDCSAGEWKNTLNLGKIQGGDVINKVPNYAEAYFDIRTVNNYETEKIFNTIKSITSNFKVLNMGYACVQEPIDFIENFKKITEGELRAKVEYSRVEGASDARYFSQLGIPIIVNSLKCDNKHTKNEWVDIKQMVSFYNILVEFLSEYIDER
ncbi:MAG: M20/M25/M40 family metallo-hydrolase [Candidatus Paceibacterota bacterium]